MANSPVLITGNAAALNDVLDGTTDVSSYGSVRLQVAGTFVGNLVFETSIDGVTWVGKMLRTIGGDGTNYFATTTGQWSGDLAGRYFRIRASAWTSGVAALTVLYVNAPASVSVSLATGSLGSIALGAGQSTIGNVRAGFLTASGTISALNGVVDGVADLNTYASVRAQISGTFSGTLTYEASVDGINWQPQQLTSAGAGLQLWTTSSIVLATGDLGGRYFRIRSSSWTSGTATITLLYSSAPRATPQQTVGVQGNVNTVGQPSTNTIGRVGHDSATVSGTLAAANATLEGTTDVSIYAGVRVQVTGTFSGAVNFETSNDGAIWQATTLTTPNPTGLGGGPAVNHVGSAVSPGLWSGSLSGRYFRVRAATGWASGTATVSIVFTAAPQTGGVSLLPGVSPIGTIGHNSTIVSGTLAALNATVDGTTDTSSYSAVRVQLSGTWSGQVQFQTSLDGTNWQSQAVTTPNSTGAPSPYSTSNGVYVAQLTGRYFRVLLPVFTSGTVGVSVLYTAAQLSATNPTVSIGPGSNAIGSVNLGAGTNDIGNTANKALLAANAVALAALNASAEGALDVSSYGGVRVHITGSFTATYQFEVSIDGTNWSPSNLVASDAKAGNYRSPTYSSNNTNVVYSGPIRGRYFRVRATAYTNGTLNVSILYTGALDQSVVNLAYSAENIGSVNLQSGSTYGFTSTGAVIPVVTWKGGAGIVYGFSAFNPTASPVYVKWYNKASQPVVGTDVPMFVLAVPAGGNATWSPPNAPAGVSTGVQIVVTGGAADTDTTVPGAGVKVVGAIG